ncbi:MAG: hypothetical protein IIA83_11510 [Thaumarchaeota archaeon]|nr:hypothetical protein [Nitrososphaerota archaeon]
MPPLTLKMKKDYLPRYLQEFGFVCYQCGISLVGKDYVWEHMDDHRLHSHYENVALCCVSCNTKKIKEYDMKIKAIEFLKKREETGFKYVETPDAVEEISSESQKNRLLYPFTKQIVTEHVDTDNKYKLQDALTEIPYLSQEKFGCGAEPTIRRYIKQLTCHSAPLQIVTDDKGIDWICRRILN